MAIANYIVDFTEINELWFVVSPQNPLKDKETLAPDNQRLEIVKRAIPMNENRFKVCDIEMSMPKPSYTIDTLKVLESMHPDKEFHLILGSDSMDSITKWKNYNELIYNHKIFVYPREGSNIDELSKAYPIKVINAPLVDYSSTSIRQKLSKGESIRDLIPDSVLDYIKDLGLYQTK